MGTESGEQALQNRERAFDAADKYAQRIAHRFILHRPFPEQYVEGNLWIILHFKAARSRTDSIASVLAVCHNNREASQRAPDWFSGSISKSQALNVDLPSNWQNDPVFIGDIELMECVKPELSTTVRLYTIQNTVNDSIAKLGKIYMTLHGSTKVGPFFPEWKECKLSDRAAIGFHEKTVRMIQGGLEIVDGVTQGRGSVPRERDAEIVGNRHFPLVSIGLSPHTISIRPDVSAENEFELVDMMFGPLDL